jgi:hypothetical protein
MRMARVEKGMGLLWSSRSQKFLAGKQVVGPYFHRCPAFLKPKTVQTKVDVNIYQSQKCQKRN